MEHHGLRVRLRPHPLHQVRERQPTPLGDAGPPLNAVVQRDLGLLAQGPLVGTLPLAHRKGEMSSRRNWARGTPRLSSADITGVTIALAERCTSRGRRRANQLASAFTTTMTPMPSR